MKNATGFTDYLTTVRAWADTRPEHVAVGFLTEKSGRLEAQEWSYRELLSRGDAVAAQLREEHQPGETALLLYPPGLSFVAAFFGCLASGVIAVPAPIPDGRDKAKERLAGIVADSGARTILTDTTTAALLAGWAATLPGKVRVRPTDSIPADRGGSFEPLAAKPSDIAFLQYTSGSTSDPKGVMVTRGNLAHNVREIQRSVHSSEDTSMVSWLPQFHDMGLIGMILHPLFIGGSSRFLSPVTFIKRPIQWIRAMSDHAATFAMVPNFAFDLVARRYNADDFDGVDLSSVRYIFNGSEPVQLESMRRFTELLSPKGLAPNAVLPVYGLAEATLFVTATSPGTAAVRASVDRDALADNRLVLVPADEPNARVLVASGHPQSLEVIVVDADGWRLGDGRVGEIWIRGESVAAGYWNRPELSAHTFGASPVGETGGWLRTGDLGALLGGELFITGRVKDVIIVNGRNLHAHDIEAAARSAAPELARGVGAAFAVGSPERLVLVHEIRPEDIESRSPDDVAASVRTAIFADFATPLSDCLLVPKGSVSRTTSGKIRRSHMRELYENGQLQPFAEAANEHV
ncbi:fatty acyl-AMP ligase [Segniliparus rotundus]|uniref:fatty acyl-AMP ligase n=1 Tax=Segniliparus rotundus TaxID=286802 RepID=UPI0002E585BA|nr:fatty acyl-AMP ligase [Segniliparus rotundus]